MQESAMRLDQFTNSWKTLKWLLERFSKYLCSSATTTGAFRLWQWHVGKENLGAVLPITLQATDPPPRTSNADFRPSLFPHSETFMIEHLLAAQTSLVPSPANKIYPSRFLIPTYHYTIKTRYWSIYPNRNQTQFHKYQDGSYISRTQKMKLNRNFKIKIIYLKISIIFSF